MGGSLVVNFLFLTRLFRKPGYTCACGAGPYLSDIRASYNRPAKGGDLVKAGGARSSYVIPGGRAISLNSHTDIASGLANLAAYIDTLCTMGAIDLW